MILFLLSTKWRYIPIGLGKKKDELVGPSLARSTSLPERICGY
jgi:hypothetical protein